MSASLPYDPTHANLNVQTNNTGLVNISSYTTVSGIPGFLQSTAVQGNGLTSAVPVSGADVSLAHVRGSAAIVLMPPRTNYPTGSLSAPVTTYYEHDYYAGTVQVKTLSAYPPVIPPTQNGDNTQYRVDTDFDLQGRVVKEYDPYAVSSIESSSSSTSSSEADEYHPFTQTIYDEPTGAAIQSIRNPDSAAAPGDPQYNLTTDFRVDPLGRRVLTLGPPFLSPLPVAEVEGEAALASGGAR